MNEYSRSLCAFLLNIPIEENKKIDFILNKKEEESFYEKRPLFEGVEPVTKWTFVSEFEIGNNTLLNFMVTHEIEKIEKIHIPFPYEENFLEKYYKVDEVNAYFFGKDNMKIMFFDINHRVASSVLKRTFKENRYFKKIGVDFKKIIDLKEKDDFIGEIEGFWAGMNKDSIRTIAGFGADLSDSELLKESIEKLKALYFNYTAKNGTQFERLLLSNNGVLAVKEKLTTKDLINLYIELMEREFFVLEDI
jgi:hypothetical protein